MSEPEDAPIPYEDQPATPDDPNKLDLPVRPANPPESTTEVGGTTGTGTIVAIITHNAAIAGMADRVVRVSSGTIASIQRNAKRISPSELAW